MQTVTDVRLILSLIVRLMYTALLLSIGVRTPTTLPTRMAFAVLDYRQAQALARRRMVARAHSAVGKNGPLTVADAIEAYLEFLENNRKSAADARCKAKALILPRLGNIEVGSLTTEKIRQWHRDLAKAAPRLRTRPGEAQKYGAAANDDETRRARRATANRLLTILKAALNRAWRDGKAATDEAWRRVEPFEGVDAARLRYFTVAEARRLLNACEPDFREMARAALLTGCRYGELANLTVGDFNPDAATLTIRMAKAGKPRHVILTEEGVEFFKQWCAGRDGAARLFLKQNGQPWSTAHQSRPMAAACRRANIKPHAGFHVLRHSWASLSIMNGMPLMVVARNLGHADTRMVERHYGHLAPSYVADAIRAGAPQFGFVAPSNVAVLGEQK